MKFNNYYEFMRIYNSVIKNDEEKLLLTDCSAQELIKLILFHIEEYGFKTKGIFNFMLAKYQTINEKVYNFELEYDLPYYITFKKAMIVKDFYHTCLADPFVIIHDTIS